MSLRFGNSHKEYVLRIDSMWLRRLRAVCSQISEQLRLPLWFPHIPIALLTALGGFLLLDSNFAQSWGEYLFLLIEKPQSLSPKLILPLLLGSGMLLMASGLLLRSRLAWLIASLLVLIGLVNISIEHSGAGLLTYFAFILTALFFSWRSFERSSVTASSLFAITSVLMLISYSTLGAYYLGDEFAPTINDFSTSFYWSMVTMSTVGYGDISPVSNDARLFTASVIVLGVAVFATALTAVVAPVISQSFAKIIHNKGKQMKRENHFIVLGHTPLAAHTAKSLQKRGQKVTRVFRQEPSPQEASAFDYLVGEPSNIEVLQEAGVTQAEAVVCMLADDSENAFVVLAVRDLAPKVETIVAVNDANHLARIKLVHPDVLLTPQLLGGELTAMILAGEEVTPEFIMSHAFKRLSDS